MFAALFVFATQLQARSRDANNTSSTAIHSNSMTSTEFPDLNHSDLSKFPLPYFLYFIYIIGAGFSIDVARGGKEAFSKSNFSITNLPLFLNTLKHQ
ncbi:hypothetical protein L207DRAFT_318931 [Hyaloscypha variabilis F]|uniref:Uncharacterized protein n=1 Tax=Hyaloscypha variabilis (strain UAMH 11265 / GT02V1 / F) TaxID=1149755 RepID=A0A2J6RW40_HYAVF|nr:hypothetical protein L207DRAFT_318931 [Hyaloscypha variabilis F]